jgi:hypothetical protein
MKHEKEVMQGRGHIEDLGVDGKRILKRILKKQDGKV